MRKLPVDLNRRFQLRAFFYERRIARLIEATAGIGKLRVDLVEAPRHRTQTVDQRAVAAFFASRAVLRAAASSCFLRAAAERWLNLSTRPAVSTSFCCPVNSGWQAAQISTEISGSVEPVTNVLPQAQCTRASGYHLGWILVFTASALYQGCQKEPPPRPPKP